MEDVTSILASPLDDLLRINVSIRMMCGEEFALSYCRLAKSDSLPRRSASPCSLASPVISRVDDLYSTWKSQMVTHPIMTRLNVA